MRINKKLLAYGMIIIILINLIILGFIIFNKFNEKNISLDNNGLITINVPDKVEYELSPYIKNEYFNIDEITFQSKDAEISSYLINPHTTERLPGIVLLPGSGVSKEPALDFGATLSQLGFVVLIIDQRGIGASTGTINTIEEDFNNFKDGKDVFLHLMIYDALLATNILKQQTNVESNNILLVGESMGGRNAIIATSIDKSIKGTLGISTGGFGIEHTEDQDEGLFIKSIDTDSYIESISPRKVAMIHNFNDPIIAIQSAIKTVDIAKDPKLFVYINESLETNPECKHGYCPEMHNALKDSLRFLLN